MNRHLAHALGATALGALLLQPVITMADPPPHARNENSAQHREYDRRGDDDRRGWDARGYPPRHDHYVRHLPPRHRVVHHHGQRYYYGNGAWYRSYGSRYVVVDPPPGLVVSFLPQFSTRVYFGGVPHYRAGPVYYVWQPRARGYVVTDRPNRRW